MEGQIRCQICDRDFWIPGVPPRTQSIVLPDHEQRPGLPCPGSGTIAALQAIREPAATPS
jgi:hypothetical protein